MTTKAFMQCRECSAPQGLASIEVTGKLPVKLDTLLAQALAQHIGETLTETTVKAVGDLVRMRGSPVYDRHWASFNYLYYPANFLKCLLVARLVAPSRVNGSFTLLDLGCGGGASTAGFVTGMQLEGLNPSAITVVDCSQAQLDLFESVTGPWLSSVVGIKVKTITSDISKACDAMSDTPDIVLLSYSLGEMTVDTQTHLREVLRKKFSAKGSLVLVVESDPNSRGVCVERVGDGSSIVPYDNVIFRCPELEGLGLNTLPKFAASRAFNDLVRRYAECWQNHDLDQLGALFSSDCLYYINDERVLRGIEAIREYWLHNSQRQRNVVFSHTTLSESASRIVLKWQASFERIDTADHRSLTGVMILEVEGGIIISLQEYYSQRREPLQRMI